MTIAQAPGLDQPTRTIAAFVLALFLAQPAAAGEPPPAPSLASTSPLAGKIWLVKERRLATPDQLAERLLEAGVVGLGETHDNPDHHAIQAWALRRLNQAGRRPAVVFEMIDSDQQGLVSANIGDVPGLGAALDWEKRGWPDWSMYRPVVEAAAAGGAVIAGNLPPALVRDVAKGKESADLRDRYGLDEPLPKDVAEAMAADIREGHCNLLPEAAVAPMVRAQRAKDAALAETLADQAARPDYGPAALVAGREHVRLDRGAPARLRQMLPSATVFALALVEVEDSEADPGAAALQDGRAAPFDAIWFTGKAAREEPCEKLARHWKKK